MTFSCRGGFMLTLALSDTLNSTQSQWPVALMIVTWPSEVFHSPTQLLTAWENGRMNWIGGNSVIESAICFLQTEASRGSWFRSKENGGLESLLRWAWSDLVWIHRSNQHLSSIQKNPRECGDWRGGFGGRRINRLLHRVTTFPF